MALVLTEEQQMIKDSAKDLFISKGSIAELRRLRDSKDELGYHPQLWSAMTELGLNALIVPQDFGGSDFGYVATGQVLEENSIKLIYQKLPTVVSSWLWPLMNSRHTNLIKSQQPLMERLLPEEKNSF